MKAKEKSTFGQRLRDLRAENNLTQEEAADLIGTALSSVNRWETGKTVPRSKTINKIAEIFVVFPEWLATGNGPRNKTEQAKFEDEVKIRKCQREKQLAAKENADSGKTVLRAGYLKPALEQTREEKILGIVNRSINAVGKSRRPDARHLHRILSALRIETEDIVFFGSASGSEPKADSEAISDINSLIGSLRELEITSSEREELYFYLNEKRSDHEMNLLFK